MHSVPFTEPSQVPLIIKLLRKQALFNTLISSCIRVSNSKQGNLEMNFNLPNVYV